MVLASSHLLVQGWPSPEMYLAGMSRSSLQLLPLLVTWTREQGLVLEAPSFLDLLSLLASLNFSSTSIALALVAS